MVRVNFKNISTSGFHEDALTTITLDDTILNFGSLTTTGDLASDISAYADSVTIRKGVLSGLGGLNARRQGVAGLK